MPVFTPLVSLALQIAAQEADATNYTAIEPAHVFIALCKLDRFANINSLLAMGIPEVQANAIEAEIDLLMGQLNRVGLNPTTARRDLRSFMGMGSYSGSHDNRELHRSDQTRQAFTNAEKIAKQNKTNMVTVSQLLAGLLREGHGVLVKWLSKTGINIAELEKLARGSTAPQQTPVQDSAPVVHHATDQMGSAPAMPTEDVKAWVETRNIGPTGKFQTLVMEIIKLLNQTDPLSIVILADKTDDTEGLLTDLALEMNQPQTPQSLRKKQLMTIDLQSMAKNINYQGEFGERVQNFITEAAEKADTIWFCDQLETLIGSGRYRPDMNAPTEAFLKQLTEGRIQVVGVLSPVEYHKHVRNSYKMRRVLTTIALKQAPNQANQASATEPLANPQTRPVAPSPVSPAKPEKISQSSAPPPQDNVDYLRWINLDKPAHSPAKPTPKPTPPNPSRKLVDARLQTLKARLGAFGLVLKIEEPAEALLISVADDGQTALENLVATEVEDKVGGMLIRGELRKGKWVTLGRMGDHLLIQPS